MKKMKKIILRHDIANIDKAEINEDGFLSIESTVTRSGIFLYSDAQGELRKELRHPDDVFNSDSMESLKMIPMTLLHPRERIVNSDNAKDLQVGFTGENVRQDGNNLLINMTITDKTAIDSIQSGKTKQLSLGYRLNLDETPGDFEGQRFDARQTDIIYNHLALVPKARAGNQASIKLDGADAYQTSTLKKQKKEITMSHVKIDGIEYEAAPEVINALSKAEAKVDSTKTELTTFKTDKEEIQGKLDSALEDNEKLKETSNVDEAVQAGVAARIKLITEATPRLDEATIKNLDSMTDTEIKKAVILKAQPKAKDKLDSDDVTDVYINARFDAVLETEVKKDKQSDNRKKLNNNDNNDDDRIDSATAKSNFDKSLTNRWKPVKA